MQYSAFNYLKILLTGLAFLGLFYSCSVENLEEEEELKEINLVAGNSNNSDIIKDQYIILLSEKPGNQDRRASEVLESLVKQARSMPGARIKGTFRHTLTGFAAKLTPAQVEKFRKDSRILSITPDRLIELEDAEIAAAVAVQEYASWGLDRIDQQTVLLDRSYVYTATGSGVNAYIMDSGIRYSHNEFGGRASLGVDLVLQFPDEEYDINDPDLEPGNDCGGHGTHVTGTVGGEKYGVAKDVNLISVRVFSCRGITSESRVIQAVEWITENAVKPAVVNMSLGGDAYELLDIAVENSVATGIVYVAAAGNNRVDACAFSPARTPGAITVGATEIGNNRAWFSNYGECLDVYAPGENILSAGIADDTEAIIKNGTSMAAPHVTGIVALYLEKNPTATPAEVHAAIIKNATPNIVTNVPSGPTNLAHSLWEPVSFQPSLPPQLNLQAIGIKNKSSSDVYLVWEPTDDPYVNIYRNGVFFRNEPNTGELRIFSTGKNSDSFRLCETHFQNCSNEVTPVYDGETDFVPNKPPTSQFTYEVNGLEVTFQDTSTDEDGTITRWRWYLGEDIAASTQNIVYTYREPGTYTVELFVFDDKEAQSYSQQVISVGSVTPSPEEIILSASGYKDKGKWRTDLSWTPAGTSAKVDLYRNGSFLRSAENTGAYKDITNFKGGGSLIYKVCEAGTTNCSNEVTVQF